MHHQYVYVEVVVLISILCKGNDTVQG